MRFKKELEKILRSEFYVNEHDDCDDSCSKKWYSNEAFKRALTSIINLVDKDIIGEDEENKSYGDPKRVWVARVANNHNQLRAKQRNRLRDGE